MVLSSCGGGGPGDTQAGLNDNGNGGGVGTGGTGSYTNGPISGLGSIIVNGVRYDVSQAAVVSDDESGTHSTDELRLGVVVEVQGSGVLPGSNGTTPVASANTVRFSSDLIGKISAVDDVNRTVTVLGQTVRLNGKTVRPVALAVNDVIAVYGMSDAAGSYTATRIDVLPPTTERYKIAGVLTRIDTLGKVLYMGQGGNLPVSYAALDDLPDGVSADARIRVWFDANAMGGIWSATRVRVDRALVSDVDEARLDGLITQLPDVLGVMKVNGALVDVSRLSGLPALSLGLRVQVEGSLMDGVLTAEELSIENEEELEGDYIELYGYVSQLDVLNRTFVLRGVPVSYAQSVVEGDLSDAQACFKVKGQHYNEARQLVATTVEKEDGEECRH